MLDRAQWIAALRDPKNKQRYGYLKIDGGYCCLGLGLETAGVPNSSMAEGSSIYEFSGSLTMPNAQQREILGISDNLAAAMVAWNDSRTVSFKDIADFLESKKMSPAMEDVPLSRLQQMAVAAYTLG